MGRAVRAMGRVMAAALALAAGAVGAAAQVQTATLTLEEAIDLARRSNPQYRMAVNDGVDADWAAREAYGSFLPSLTVSNSFSYQASGTPRLGNLSAAEFGLSRTPEYYFSDYRVQLGLSVSGGSFFRAAQARANAHAVDARIEAAGFDLEGSVTRQYLAALRARDALLIAQSAVESAAGAMRLVDARASVGAATRLDVTQAQVDLGRAEVGLVQAENDWDAERLRLMQTIGVVFEGDYELTSRFEVFAPEWDVEALTDMALRGHPQLNAARRSEDAARAAARAARMQYLPSLSMGGAWSGYVRRAGDDGYLLTQARNQAQNRIDQCELMNRISAGLTQPLPDRPDDCARFALDAADEAAILAQNREFPFRYATSPASFALTVSLPIIDGFTRERNVQTARAAAEDARYQRRAEELARRTEVATVLGSLRTAYRTVRIEERNVEAASEQLELARERYRLGAGCGSAVVGSPSSICTSFLELTQAQERKARADQAHLSAVYGFHEALIALEAAVGRKLR
jgi:outer membrane protein